MKPFPHLTNGFGAASAAALLVFCAGGIAVAQPPAPAARSASPANVAAQQIRPAGEAALNPQPLPPVEDGGVAAALNPQPLPPVGGPKPRRAKAHLQAPLAR